MIVDRDLQEKMDEYAESLKNMYNISSDLMLIDYEANLIKIDGIDYPMDKIEQIINIVTDGDKNKQKEYSKKFKFDEKKYEKYYTIVDYRYFYIKNMIEMGFSIYDIAKYFQVKPQQIKDAIKQMPEIDENNISKTNISDETFQLIAEGRDRYLEHALLKEKDPIKAGQKYGFFKIPDKKDITLLVMNAITQNNYEWIKKQFPDIDEVFSMTLQETRKAYRTSKKSKALPYLNIKSSALNWNHIRDVYFISKQYPEVIELKQYRFSNDEISEYLNISKEEVYHVINVLNAKCNGISVLEALLPTRASLDVNILKIATEMIKSGDKLKDIVNISGLHNNYVTDIREQLQKTGEIKENFSDAKRLKIRREKVIDLYVNSGKSQEEVAEILNISRATVVTDIQTYEIEHPEVANAIRQKKLFMYRASRAEMLIREILKPYGFERIMKGELNNEGLGKKGLNMYHEEKKIAIEYDGYLINFNGQFLGHTVERDTAKDAVLKEMGLNIIRIREPQLPQYEDKDVKFFYTNTECGNIYSKEFLLCVNQLINYLNVNYNFHIEPVTSIAPYETKINKEYLKNVVKLNEMNMFSWKEMSNSLNARVIDIKQNGTVDVQFENGVIMSGERLQKYKNGTVAYPNIPPYVIKNMNKVRPLDPSTNAKTIKMIGANNKNDTKVLIDDTYVLNHVSLKEIQEGILTAKHQKELNELKERNDIATVQQAPRMKHNQNIIFGQARINNNQHEKDNDQERTI